MLNNGIACYESKLVACGNAMDWWGLLAGFVGIGAAFLLGEWNQRRKLNQAADRARKSVLLACHGVRITAAAIDYPNFRNLADNVVVDVAELKDPLVKAWRALIALIAHLESVERSAAITDYNQLLEIELLKSLITIYEGDLNMAHRFIAVGRLPGSTSTLFSINSLISDQLVTTIKSLTKS